MNSQKLIEVMPYVLSVLVTIIIALLIFWYTAPPENTLPEVYGVM